MEKPWFYAPDVSTPKYALNEEESHHCSRVLRLSEGAELTLADGRGGIYDARISLIGKRQTMLEVYNKVFVEKFSKAEVSLAVAPTKNNARYEWFIEKAVEIGVSTILPLLCENGERTILRRDRMEKLIVSAAKQSRQAWFPAIGETLAIADLIAGAAQEVKLIAWCDDTLRQGISSFYKAGQSILVLIGPEGDFTPEEVKRAVNKGFHPISLGANRLRTETAAIVACSHIQFINTFAS